jgi:ribosomal protein S2
MASKEIEWYNKKNNLKITDFINSYGYLGLTNWRTWKPATLPYIFEKSGASCVKFDLTQTQVSFEKAFQGLKEILPKPPHHRDRSGRCDSDNPCAILLIGTSLESKKVVRDISNYFNMIESYAQQPPADNPMDIEIFYITHKWKGGMISNWQETKKRIKRLEEGVVSSPSKTRKYLKALRKHEELKEQIAGLEGLEGRPELVIFTNPAYDSYALKECHDLGLKIMALVNTDCNLEMIDYPIPINTHCDKSIRVILESLLTYYIRYFYENPYFSFPSV